MTTLNVDDVGLVQNRSRVYQGAGRSAEGQFSSNAPVETVDIMAEEAPGADSIALQPESQISITCEASPDQQDAASGHAAALASTVINSRRFMSSIRNFLP